MKTCYASIVSLLNYYFDRVFMISSEEKIQATGKSSSFYLPFSYAKFFNEINHAELVVDDTMSPEIVEIIIR